MRNPTIWLFLILFSWGQSHAQENSDSLPRPIGIQVEIGQTGIASTSGTPRIFQSISPQSLILKNDFDDYLHVNPERNIKNVQLSIWLSQALKGPKSNSKKGAFHARAGISYHDGVLLSGYFDKKTIIQSDTARFGSQHSMLVLDSIHKETLNMEYRSHGIKIGLGIMRKSNFLQDSVLQLFIGVDFLLGYFFQNTAEIEITRDEGIQWRRYLDPTSQQERMQSNPRRILHENHTVRNYFSASVRIPFGWEARPFIQTKFLKGLSIPVSIIPIFSYNTIPDIQPEWVYGFTVMLGLKYEFN